jgi:hypothetical protein
VTQPDNLPRTLITRIIGNAEVIAADWPSYNAALNAALVTELGTGSPGSGHSDPTLALVVARARVVDEANEVLEALEAALASLALVRRLTGQRQRYANVEALQAAVRANRCCGGSGLTGALTWGRPDCDNLIVYKEARLCSPCYQAWRHWLSTPAAQQQEAG